MRYFAKAPAFGPFNQQGERILALNVETTYVLATPNYDHFIASLT
jgi:hypothetical protein